MSSIEPNNSGSEIDGTEEVTGGLVVAGGNAAILLELVEELLNQMTRPVQVLVVFAPLFAATLGRNHDAFARVVQWINDPFLGIVRFVGDDGGGWRVGQQGIGTFQIMRLPRRQVKSGRIAQSIDGGMDFRAQPAAAAPDRFSFGPLFFAPALC